MAEKRASVLGGDPLLLVPVILLLCFGLIMVYSASSNLAAHRLGDGYFYLKRQALFCALGLGLMAAVTRIPTSLYARLAYPLLLAGLAVLALLLVPGLGHVVNHSSRWLKVGGFSFQPAELAKIPLAFYMAYSMSRKGPEMRSFSRGLLPHLVVAGGFMGLIVWQPDLGTAVIIGAWVMILLFVGGARFYHLAGLMTVFAAATGWLIMNADYRLKRWLVFLDPWEDPQGAGFQIIHSFLAFGSGGILGVGLGNSKQKLFYLPEPHTDFVFSITGEELGFVGASLMILLFGILLWRGFRTALNARDLYRTYLALGLTCMLGLQVVVNMGVVTGMLPTKGLTLPLISYGGSSLVTTLISVGILLRISAET